MGDLEGQQETEAQKPVKGNRYFRSAGNTGDFSERQNWEKVPRC